MASTACSKNMAESLAHEPNLVVDSAASNPPLDVEPTSATASSALLPEHVKAGLPALAASLKHLPVSEPFPHPEDEILEQSDAHTCRDTISEQDVSIVGSNAHLLPSALPADELITNQELSLQSAPSSHAAATNDVSDSALETSQQNSISVVKPASTFASSGTVADATAEPSAEHPSAGDSAMHVDDLMSQHPNTKIAETAPRPMEVDVSLSKHPQLSIDVPATEPESGREPIPNRKRANSGSDMVSSLRPVVFG